MAKLIEADTTARDRRSDEFPAALRPNRPRDRGTQPQLIGLQEVALWRHGPLGGPATIVDYEFLQTLLGDLGALGERYQPVNVQQESDVTGPAFLTGVLQNVRLTDRDVLLKRANGSVKLLDSGGGQYAC